MAKQHTRHEGEEKGLLTLYREKSLTSMARRILALGDMDVAEKGHTSSHAPAEDRYLGHNPGQLVAVGTSHQGERRGMAQSSETSPASLGLHTHSRPSHLRGAGQCPRVSHREMGQVGSSLCPCL